MRGRMAVSVSVIAVAAAVGALAHVRSLAVAERYELGRLAQVEAQQLAEGVRLRQHWERAGDPGTLAKRAARDLGMRHPQSKQVVR